MRKNWGGPVIAAAAQGTALSLNCRRNRNGNRANTARNTRYQVSGWAARVGSNRFKCQQHSSPATQVKPIAGIQSSENSLVTPNSSTTRSNPSPKTGEGLANGSRNVA